MRSFMNGSCIVAYFICLFFGEWTPAAIFMLAFFVNQNIQDRKS